MATLFWFFLLPLALADADLPCEGFEVVEGLSLVDVEAPAAFGVKVLQAEKAESEDGCWRQCCGMATCDLAVMSNGTCHIVHCSVKGFNMCQMTAQEGTRAYRRVEAGVQPKQEDFCLVKGETGPCRAYFIRWRYDAETETCSNFTYGGCPMNLNNHAGEEECMKKCKGVKATKSEGNPTPERLVADTPLSVKKPEPAAAQAPKVGNFKDYCAAPPSTGNCRAAFTRYYYDPSEMACKTFIYGGCKPKENNYLTEADCLKMCAGRSEEDDSDADQHFFHRPLTSVVLPILLAVMAATLLGVMITFFVKMSKKNQQNAGFHAMWNPIDDKECLMNNAYTL